MSASNSRVRVVVGEHNICDNVNEGGQVIDASQVYVHPNYANNDNDIAIVKVTFRQLLLHYSLLSFHKTSSSTAMWGLPACQQGAGVEHFIIQMCRDSTESTNKSCSPLARIVNKILTFALRHWGFKTGSAQIILNFLCSTRGIGVQFLQGGFFYCSPPQNQKFF